MQERLHGQPCCWTDFSCSHLAGSYLHALGPLEPLQAKSEKAIPLAAVTLSNLAVPPPSYRCSSSGGSPAHPMARQKKSSGMILPLSQNEGRNTDRSREGAILTFQAAAPTISRLDMQQAARFLSS